MPRTLDFSQPPEYCFSSYRYFYPGEKHVTRICREDVLLFVFSGVLNFSEAGVPVSVPAGRYYIQEAGIYQQGPIPSDTPKYFYIHFHGKTAESCPDGVPRGGLPLGSMYSHPAMRPLFDRLDALEHRENSTRLVRTAAFYDILTALYEGRYSEEPSSAHEVEVYLSENFTREISLDRIAEKLHYSKDHIIRSFKAKYGVTPYKYMTHLRMENAKQLLISTARSVSRIASDCGYGDESSFYRAFRAETGKSPAYWKSELFKKSL